MRAVFETLGMQDVVAKSLGSSNPYNMVRATFDALKHQDSPRSVAARRNIKVSTLQARRREADAEAEPADRVIGEQPGEAHMAKTQQDHHGRADRQPDPPPSHASARR